VENKFRGGEVSLRGPGTLTRNLNMLNMLKQEIIHQEQGGINAQPSQYIESSLSTRFSRTVATFSSNFGETEAFSFPKISHSEDCSSKQDENVALRTVRMVEFIFHLVQNETCIWMSRLLALHKTSKNYKPITGARTNHKDTHQTPCEDDLVLLLLAADQPPPRPPWSKVTAT